MKSPKKVALGIALLLFGMSFAAASYYGGPFILEEPRRSVLDQLGDPEREQRNYDEDLRQIIAKEMLGGGVVAAIGVFMAILGSIPEKKQ